MSKTKSIAIIGGGASGMAAAVTAARLGVKVTLIEAQPRVGRKLLSTGNGRCNITNARMSPDHFRSTHHARIVKLLDITPPDDILDFLRSLGLECFEEREGRIYPRSEQATAVLDMFRAELDRLGVETVCDFRVSSVKPSGGGFSIKGAEQSIFAERVIFACGSQAAPQLGGCSDGMALMKATGHKYSAFIPALVGLKVDSPHLRALKGVRWRCQLTLMHENRSVHTEGGEVQFNEDNLSGIVTMQMSSRAARYRSGCCLVADLLPEYTPEQTIELLGDMRSLLGHLPIDGFLAGLLNKRLAACLLKSAGITGLSRRADELTDRELKAIASKAKGWEFPITGSCGWKTAQVASGGVLLDQFGDDLQSRLVPGLYACGELLDCDGDCGGYNLHWAWCSGIIAGGSAARSLKK